MSMQSESQRLDKDATVEMFELTTPSGARLFMFNGAQSGEPVTFAGNTYEAIPCRLSGVEFDGQGQLPQPTFEVSARGVALRGQIISENALVGATLVHRVTLAKFLGDVIAVSEYDPAVWTISQMSSLAGGTASFKLRAEIDQPNKKVPARQCRRTCTHRYRVWDAAANKWRYDSADPCPYAGEAMFNIAGDAVSDPAEDVCSLQYKTGCRKRYGYEPNPFSGAPNIRNTSE